MHSITTFILASLILTSIAAASEIAVSPRYREGDFKLVMAGKAADLNVDQEDFKVVHIAAECFAADVERVTGVRPTVKGKRQDLSDYAVLVGTFGKSPLINDLVSRGKLDVKGITGKWESFLITTVRDPLPGVKTALVIAGSDRRGTAFGLFSLSEAIGVSPWIWWADVAPDYRDTLVLASGTYTSKPPSVKYRGIFINDEDWGLQPWAARTYEPETGDIGPRTYAKVFELLLRLKANYLWPAMHPCTKAFNLYPANKVVADDYAIVMGSSHCEMMLRNNVTEFEEKRRGVWDYNLNRTNILAYWQQRLEQNGAFENLYTIGMRGLHDSGMPGGGTPAQKVALLQQVIDDQRGLIAKTICPDPAQVPQIFCPYKEVLSLYQNGLKVPDDVTLVWPDDNYGYIRQLSNPEEQKRSGGSGVYYHISYWGSPEDYLWLGTVPPALIWAEMSKAYDHGARRMWIVNVGDIKPNELGIDFFLRMAWDVPAWNEDAQAVFLTRWAERDFGKDYAADIAGIMDEYYRLNFSVKPEHLLKVKFTTNYGESDQRLQRFSQLVAKTDALAIRLPRAKRDAFYELVVYPVRCSALMNEKHLSASFELSQKAHEKIQAETRYFNEQLVGGKWRHIISSNPRDRPVYQKLHQNTKPVAVAAPPATASFTEDATFSIEAEHPTRKVGGGNAKWTVIEGLGRTGSSITLLPTTASIPESAVLEYQFDARKAGPVKVMVYCIPTHALYPVMKLRYAASLDGEAPRIVDIDAKEYSHDWSANVLRASSIGTTEHSVTGPGKHTLQLRPLDTGIVFDKIVIDQGDMKPSLLGPPETFRALTSVATASEIAVSSLDLNKAAQGSWKARANKSTNGKPITLGGVVYTNGLGSHTKFRLAIDCHGTAKRFNATVGINDGATKKHASVVFRVEGDGKKLWNSPVMRSGDTPQAVDVDLAGVKQLVLILWNGEGGGQAEDYGDWANATITYDGAVPVAVESAIPRKILTPPVALTPRINGARVYGARPGNPFLFCVPVTGERPMKVAASGLPKGLTLDADSGIITGTTPAAGTYKVKLTATNAKGSATRELSIVAGDTLALTPPMGYNSWNCFAGSVTQEKILQQAEGMVASGLRDHGYAYINIDDFWMPKNTEKHDGSPCKDETLRGVERDPVTGKINCNPRFPDMPGLVARIHSLGLKAGIYSSPGPKTCGGCVSSWQFEKQDAERFADWGFDYLKYDWCSYDHVVKGDGRDKEYAKKPYAVMDEHLRAQKRDIVFSLCQYGMADVWEWAAEVHGNTWRTTGDIGDSWKSMAGIGFKQGGHEKYVKPGCWNDPDMMIVGWVWGRFTNLSDDEQYTHVSLWCMLAAPLLLGNDLTHVDEFTLNVLGNDEVIEVNQDPLGRMASCIASNGETRVYAKEMEDGSLAVGLFNLGDETVPVSITWTDLKLKGPQRVRDLWRQKDLGKEADGFTSDVPRHGVILIRVFPAK